MDSYRASRYICIATVRIASWGFCWIIHLQLAAGWNPIAAGVCVCTHTYTPATLLRVLRASSVRLPAVGGSSSICGGCMYCHRSGRSKVYTGVHSQWRVEYAAKYPPVTATTVCVSILEWMSCSRTECIYTAHSCRTGSS